MEIKDQSLEKVHWEKSPVNKVQPVEKSSDKENYDVILAEVDWARYFPGAFVSKHA